MARQGERRSIRLVHFADYHAHAVPFYALGEPGSAGVARLIAHLRAARPDALVTNGGDMFNAGSPAWSDRYRGLEWPWFNGLVDVMAFGNHDSDYGAGVFARCRRSLDHPVLCANLVDDRGDPVLRVDGFASMVHEVDGVRLGLVAAAGPDVTELVLDEGPPVPGTHFVDRTSVVEREVARLRQEARVDAVILVGHGLHEDDVALARAVPGIDVVLGTHSHRLQEPTTVPGTDTVIVAPHQYATHVADLRLDFRGGALLEVRGGLVRLGPDRPEAPDIAARVACLQAQLETDPAFAHLTEVIGHAVTPVSTDGQEDGESELGDLVADVVRDAAGADLALVGSSALREPLPPGTLRVGDVVTALPYENRVLTYRVTGREVHDLLEASRRHRGTNHHAQVGGVRFHAGPDGVSDVLVRERGTSGRWRALDPASSYVLACNDFLATRTPGYSQVLVGATGHDAGHEVRAALADWIRDQGVVRGRVDGRMSRGVVAAEVR